MRFWHVSGGEVAGTKSGAAWRNGGSSLGLKVDLPPGGWRKVKISIPPPPQASKQATLLPCFYAAAETPGMYTAVIVATRFAFALRTFAHHAVHAHARRISSPVCLQQQSPPSSSSSSSSPSSCTADALARM